MCIKSEFKEICLKLATNGRSDKGFLLTSNVCPQGVFCPCPGAIYMYKIIKNVYKIRFQRDHFETCNIWAKKKGLSVVIKICPPPPPPHGLSATARGYIHMVNLEKMYVKSDLKAFVFKLSTDGQSETFWIILKLATYGQREKAFLLSSKFCPQYVVCPCLGLLYMKKHV